MNFVRKSILRVLSPALLESELNSLKIMRCVNAVTLHPSSRFHEQASVNNFQNDKSKIRIGERTHIRGTLQIFAYGGEIVVGNNCYVGENSYIWSGERIEIGNDVLISHSVNIVDTNSHELNHSERANGYHEIITKGHSMEKGNIITAPIIIEDNVWISFGVIILKGVRIGKGAIVSAGSVVTKDIPSFT
ncbi:MAG TPA: acyltransferase, partial [Bacteroidia bacterium]